jgi:hypothetical protein
MSFKLHKTKAQDGTWLGFIANRWGGIEAATSCQSEEGMNAWFDAFVEMKTAPSVIADALTPVEETKEEVKEEVEEETEGEIERSRAKSSRFGAKRGNK